VEPEEKFIAAFLRPPLYSIEFDRGFGTLYTAVYRPRLGTMELRWPRGTWHLNLYGGPDEVRRIYTPETTTNSITDETPTEAGSPLLTPTSQSAAT